MTPAYENEFVKLAFTEAELVLTYKQNIVHFVQTAVTEPVKVGFFKAQPEHSLLASVRFPYEFSDNYDERYSVSLQNNDVTRQETIELKIEDSDGAEFCSLHIYSDYATLTAQNEYWKQDETLKDNLKNALQQSLRAANNLVIKTVWETDGMTVAIGTDVLERSIKHLSLMVPVAAQYENEQVTIKKPKQRLRLTPSPKRAYIQYQPERSRLET